AMEMAAPDPEFDEIVEPMEMAAAIPEPMPEPMVAEVAGPLAMEAPIAPRVEDPVVEDPVVEAPIAMESLARLTNAIAEAAAEVMEQPASAMAAAAFGASPTASLPMPSPLPEPSLGATILASGIVQKPRTAANEMLAPRERAMISMKSTLTFARLLERPFVLACGTFPAQVAHVVLAPHPAFKSPQQSVALVIRATI